MWVWRPDTIKRTRVLQIRTKGIRTWKGFFGTAYVTTGGKLYWILENRKIEFVYWAGMLKQIAKREGRELYDLKLQLVGMGAEIRDWEWGQMCTERCPDVKGIAENIGNWNSGMWRFLNHQWFCQIERRMKYFGKTSVIETLEYGNS
jgi:hypothetical protein